jgi:diguanylate cyclase (GGDEF)-like protein
MAPSPQPPRQGLPFRLLRAFLIGTSGIFAVAAIYLSFLIHDRQDTLSKVSRYDVAWSASQGVNEFVRLYQRVSALAAAPSEELREEVQLRFEILKGRVDLFEAGDFQTFVSETAERQSIVRRLSRLVDRMDPEMRRLEEPQVAHSLTQIMAPLETDLIGLASEANHFSGIQVAEFDEELLGLHGTFTAVAGGFFLCGLAFIGLLGWHNRLLARTHEKLRAAIADLLRASFDLEASNAAVQDANRELSEQNDLFDAALNNMSQGLCMFGPDRRLIVSNGKFAEMFSLPADCLKPGVTPDQIVACTIDNGICSPEAARGIHSQQQLLIDGAEPGILVQEFEDGRIISICHQPMATGGWVATYEDVTERHRSEARIAYMARHDPLTGLPNRMLFREHLEGLLADGRAQEQAAAVMCLDLDNFKNVNDSLGHPVGDALLCEVAGRISDLCGPAGMVARMGGDEFVMVLRGAAAEDAETVANALVEAIGAPYQLDGHHVVIGTSIGIAVAAERGVHVDDLLNRADLALYRAKADGRGTYRRFEPEMDERLQRWRMIELDLRTANFDEDFDVLFQPILDLKTGQITAVEALLRWTGSRHGAVSPTEFIPIAEDSGAIVQLGRRVLERACAVAVGLPSNVSVAVNLSPTQFRRSDIVDTVGKVLCATGLAANRLELEITETLLLEDSKETHSALKQLRALGVRISLDDFGTGYSSLGYLRRFTVDKVKIDRVFVAGISHDRGHLAIVQAIVSLSQALGIRTVAEGIETEEQLLIIRASGCDEAQGHLFSLPRPEAELRELFTGKAPKLNVA